MARIEKFSQVTKSKLHPAQSLGETFSRILVFSLWFVATAAPVVAAPTPTNSPLPPPPALPAGVSAAVPPTPPAATPVSTHPTEDEEEFTRLHANPDNCAVSEKINGQYSCRTTRNVVSGAQAANMSMQMLGQISVAGASQGFQNRVMTGTYSDAASGQAAALQAAEDTQIAAAAAQGAPAVTNLILGAVQISYANKAAKNAKNFQDAQQSSDNDDHIRTQTLENVVAPDHVGDVTRQERKDVTHTIGEAVKEQRNIASEAKVSGMMSVMTGMQEGISAAMAGYSASELAKAIQNLKPIVNPSSGVTPPGIPSGLGLATGGGSSAPAITGSGIDPNASSASSSGTGSTAPMPDLGSPFNPTPTGTNIPTGPDAGKFNASTPNSGGQGSGGGAVGGGGDTSPGEASQDAPKPTLASNDSNRGNAYQSSGAIVSTNSGGKGGSTGGAEAMPDFAGMLANFLPKAGDDPNKRRDSIEDFTRKQNENSMGAVYSKNDNIFERMHGAYQNIAKRNVVLW